MIIVFFFSTLKHVDIVLQIRYLQCHPMKYFVVFMIDAISICQVVILINKISIMAFVTYTEGILLCVDKTSNDTS